MPHTMTSDQIHVFLSHGSGGRRRLVGSRTTFRCSRRPGRASARADPAAEFVRRCSSGSQAVSTLHGKHPRIRLVSPIYSPVGDPSASRVLPSNASDWSPPPPPKWRRSRRVFKLLLAAVVACVVVVAAQTLVGIDQVARWVAAPSLPTLPGREMPRSRNWSGYTASSGRYTAVKATWVVPRFAPDSPGGADAIWVGIGGIRDNDLIQAGTEETVSGRGSTQYSAWIETLPQASHAVPLTVSAGDSVTVSIQQVAGDDWQVAISNDTTTQSYKAEVRYQSSLSSAEWVVEAPSAGRGRLVALDRFGSVTFSEASAVKDGRSVTIADAGGHPVTMIGGGGRALAQPSALGDEGASFTVQQAIR